MLRSTAAELINFSHASAKKKHGFYFTEDVGEFPEMRLRSSDLLALFVAEKILSQYPGTGLDRRLRADFDKIASATGGELSVTWKELRTFALSRIIRQQVDGMRKTYRGS